MSLISVFVILFAVLSVTKCNPYGDFQLNEDVFEALKDYLGSRNWYEQREDRYHMPYADKRELELDRIGYFTDEDGEDDRQGEENGQMYEEQKRSIQALAKNADFPKLTTQQSLEYISNYSYPFH